MKTSLFLSFIILAIVGGFYYFRIEEPILPTITTKENNGVVVVSTRSTNPITVIAFGDSLTAGYGGPLEDSYPSLLEKELTLINKNIKIINMGVSGETTTAGLDRVDFVISQKPSIVLLGLGANDMLRASSPKIAKENLKTIIERFQKEGITIVLLGMKSTASNGKQYRDEFDAIYPSLAKSYNLTLVPFFLEGVVLNPALNNNDGIHPNKAGYEKIVKENILPILLPILEDVTRGSSSN